MLFGTPEEVRKQARERIDIFAPQGSLFLPKFTIFLPDVRPENIVAAYQAAKLFINK